MRVFITGSTDGLGRGAAETLIKEGHQVVLHARSKDRASALANGAGTRIALIRRAFSMSLRWPLPWGEQRRPAAQALDTRFQDELMAKLAELTGYKLF